VDQLALVVKVPKVLKPRIIAAVLAKHGIAAGTEDQNLIAVEEIVRNHYLYQVLYEVESKAAADAAVEATKNSLLQIINTPPVPDVTAAAQPAAVEVAKKG
jgi:hypothetical protein